MVELIDPLVALNIRIRPLSYNLCRVFSVMLLVFYVSSGHATLAAVLRLQCWHSLFLCNLAVSRSLRQMSPKPVKLV